MAYAVGEGHELHDSAFEPALGVPDVEGEAEALSEEELGGYDIFGCYFGEFGGEVSERDVIVFCLGG